MLFIDKLNGCHLWESVLGHAVIERFINVDNCFCMEVRDNVTCCEFRWIVIMIVY